MIREYQRADLDRLLEIYAASGFDYSFPALEEPQFFAKLVVDAGDGAEMALVARHTAEMYLLMDGTKGTPQSRWEAFQRLHRAMELKLWARGVADVHCWVPPTLARRFGKRLRMLNWCQDTWPCFSRVLRGPLDPMEVQASGDASATHDECCRGTHSSDDRQPSLCAAGVGDHAGM